MMLRDPSFFMSILSKDTNRLLIFFQTNTNEVAEENNELRNIIKEVRSLKPYVVLKNQLLSKNDHNLMVLLQRHWSLIQSFTLRRSVDKVALKGVKVYALYRSQLFQSHTDAVKELHVLAQNRWKVEVYRSLPSDDATAVLYCSCRNSFQTAR
jgi:hypothetical protein